jgi:carnitine 3-dehydrogenase
MRPLHVRREIEAYIADRLQESLYREALHLINDGVATVSEIDAAVTGGPGLRWAFMGTFMAWHLGGGAGGMRHTIDQFGPALELPWSHMKAPKLTNELKNKIVEGCETEAGDRPFTELEKRRDRCLAGIQQVLAEHWYSQDQDGWPEMQ